MRDRRCHHPGFGVAVVIFAVLSLNGPERANGEVGSGDIPAEPEQVEAQQAAEESVPDPEMEPVDSSAPGPGNRRGRLFKRIGPKGLTPEQEEEAEQLRKLAAKYGTDPTAIVGRVQLTSQYLDLPQGARAVDTVARVDIPFRGNWILRTDMPFLKWSDPNRSGATSAQGTSDLSVIAGWRAYNTPEYAVLIGALATFPTAAESGLGLGKYTVGPALATARFIPRWESFLIGLLQYQTSVGGDPSRRDVSLMRGIAQVNSFWGQKWWTVVQAVWQINWEQNAKSSMTMEFELGRSIVGRLGAFVRPGVGIWGQSVLGAYDWNVEIGVRYMFASF